MDKKKRGRPPIWTEAQRRFIAEHSVHLTDAKIAEILTRVLGRVVTTVAVTRLRQAGNF